jgi:hypothetical protein
MVSVGEVLAQLESKDSMIDASGTPFSPADFTKLLEAFKKAADSVESLDLHESGIDDYSPVAELCSALSGLHDLSLCWNKLTFKGLDKVGYVILRGFLSCLLVPFLILRHTCISTVALRQNPSYVATHGGNMYDIMVYLSPIVISEFKFVHLLSRSFTCVSLYFLCDIAYL